MRREIFTEDHDLFRDQVRRFAEREIEPKVAEWNERGMVDRAIWRRLGEEGLLGANQPVEYGGAGGDFLYDAIIIEEIARVRAHGLAASLHSDICLPYIVSYGSEEQKRKHVPAAIRGEVILGIAMTEPGTGSDLAAVQTLHGGYGFMMEYPIAGDYADAAVQSIYAGSNEIMKVIIARRLGLGG